MYTNCISVPRVISVLGSVKALQVSQSSTKASLLRPRSAEASLVRAIRVLIDPFLTKHGKKTWILKPLVLISILKLINYNKCK